MDRRVGSPNALESAAIAAENSSSPATEVSSGVVSLLVDARTTLGSVPSRCTRPSEGCRQTPLTKGLSL